MEFNVSNFSLVCIIMVLSDEGNEKGKELRLPYKDKHCSTPFCVCTFILCVIFAAAVFAKKTLRYNNVFCKNIAQPHT